MKRKVLYKLLLAFIFVSQSIGVFGQNSLHQYELLLDSREIVDDVSILDPISVIRIIDDLKKYQDPSRRYVVLDSHLNTIADTNITIPFRQKLVTSEEKADELYTFYYDARRGGATILHIDSKGLETIPLKLPNRMFEPQFVISDSLVYMDNRTRHKECIYVKNRYTDGESKAYKVSKRHKAARVYSLFFKSMSNVEVAYVWREIGKHGHYVYINIWDETGRLKSGFPFKIKNKTISNLNITPSGEEGYVVTGTYGKMDGSGSTASGVFLSKVEDGSTIETKTYPFVELVHYFDYFSRYEKEDMLRKIKRLKKHEKSTDIHVGNVVHSLYQADDSYFLCVEIVTRLYDNVYGITRNGNTIAGAPQEFKGYNHSHAIVCRFDSAFDIQHDYYVPIDMNLSEMVAKPHVQIKAVVDSLLIGLAKTNSYKFAKIRPLELLQLETDSSFHANSSDIIYTRNLTIISGGSAVVYGEKIRQEKNLLGKQENIYFIEKRKLR